MARSVTLQNIVDRARIHADLRGSAFINDTEALAMLNEVWPELYDELVMSYENYYQTTSTINIAPGTSLYSLPSDFYKLIGVDFQVNNGAYITLKPFMESERNQSLTTNTNLPSGVIRLRYVPAPTTFTALSQTIDGVAGWDRLLSLLLAMDMLDAEESDSTAIARKYARTLDRIKSAAAPRDTGFPARVTDAYKPDIGLIYGSFKYRLQGDSIELLNTELLGADLYPFF